MSKMDLTAEVWLDWQTYRSFFVFDRFIRTRGWWRPALFLVVFVGLAVISFVAAAGGKQGAGLLGGVLLGLGVLLPGVHVARQALGLRQLRTRLGLKDNSRHAYTLALTENPRALVVRASGKEPQAFAWQNMHGVWHRGEVVYLYVEPGRAYILPLKQLPGQEKEALDILHKAVPADRFHAQ